MEILNQIVIMFILILLGIVCYKFKIISDKDNKALSSLLLLVINSAVIISAFQMEFSEELFYGLKLSFLFSFIVFIISILVVNLLIHDKNKVKLGIERFSAIYSNCGFMGIPLVYSIYGKEGIFYLSAFSAVFNLFVWTHGVVIMRGKFSFKLFLESMKSPAIISTIVGILLFLTKISLPSILMKAVDYVGSCNTPLAMIVAGVTIAQTNIIKSLKNPKVYLVCLLKLIVLPTIIIIILAQFPINKIIKGVIVLATACPTATTGVLFAICYDKDPDYASQLFAISTALSMMTIPFITYLNNII
ncbi:MAG: AEC family transporter [Clostridiales bacterium]|nr:AEC family transporter [Clostridiales bacterium]